MTVLKPRTIKALVESLGCKLVRVEQNKHLKVVYSFRGVELFAFLSLSPSDHRWRANAIKCIKKDLRQRGLWGE